MRFYPFFLAITAIAIGSTLLAACSGEVLTRESSGSANSASGSGSGGAGGGTAGTGGTSNGGAPSFCGGLVMAECAANEWCDFPDGLCGGDDGGGQCQPRPNGCPADCPGVCGCDGKIYCNACEGQAAGVDVSNLASCAPQESGTYSAQAEFGGLDHLLIRKADKARNVCVMLHLARPSQNSPGFSINLPDEWGTVNASITDQASDCDFGGMPSGKNVQALSGAGAVTYNTPSGKFFPCDINVHVELSFPAGEPWVKAKEPLNADGVVVKNGCQ